MQYKFNDFYSYDIENYCNYFSCRFRRDSDDAIWKFEISPWIHEGFELFIFINQIAQSGGAMVGFNNLFYDYPVLHILMEHGGNIGNRRLFQKGTTIIRDGNKGPLEGWKHVVWDRDQYCPQIDLYRIHHFDNASKRTSLKLLEFNMMMDDIQELPYDPHTELTQPQAAHLLEYNCHDVDATHDMLQYTKSMIELRCTLSEKYGRSFLNFNDTKIGEQIIMETLKGYGVHLQKGDCTLRDKIHVGDILFDYLEFERPEFQAVHEFFKSAVIDASRIKGFFGGRNKADSKCQELVSYNLAQYMDPDDVTVLRGNGKSMSLRKFHEQGLTVRDDDKFKPCNIHCIVDGFRFDFGAGGIHGSLHKTIVRGTKDDKLEDADVESFYPSIGIRNRVYPAHIGEAWCDANQWMLDERINVGKKSQLGQGYKLGMNGGYGKSNDEHSPLYDPQYTMMITINGQLSLCMLAETLIQAIPNFRMVQANTDGMTYIYPREHEQYVQELSHWWEQVTKLKLEFVEYRMMAIRDVNSYIGVSVPYKDKEGKLHPAKVKRIGAYAYTRASEDMATRELPWHKDHSAVVVAKAAEAALIRNENIEKFIRNHVKTHPYDFYLRTKVNRSGHLYFECDGEKYEEQRITRFYVSETGGSLVKESTPTERQQADWLNKPHWQHVDTGVIKQSKKKPSNKWVQVEPPSNVRPATRTNMCAGFNVTVANSIKNGTPDLTGVHIDYYVKKTRKLVDDLLV